MIQKFRGLSVASGECGSKISLERRRVPRLGLTREQFRLRQNGKIFSVVDLSGEGLALRILEREDFALFPIETVISGILNLNGEKYAVDAKVKHIDREMIGCHFEKLEPASQAALNGFLDPERLGEGLRPIPSSEGTTLWYHGPSGTDLLFWRGLDGQYSRFTLFLMGSYAQWEESGEISTGRFRLSSEQSEICGLIRFESMLLEPDSSPDVGKLQIAKTLILSSNLSQELKKWCARQLET